MQLVEDEELEVLRRLHDLVVFLMARQDEVEHHVVGEEDVWRVLFDGRAFSRRLLSRVPLHGHEIGTVQKLPDLLELAVCEGVHRIDDYRPYAWGRIGFLLADDPVHYRDEEREGLPRSGSRRDDETFVARHHRECRRLMTVELNGLGARRLFLLAGLKYLRRLGLDIPLPRKLVNECAFAVVGVDLDERIWPEAPLVVCRLDFACDVRGSRRRETRRELLVVLDKPIPELENVVHRACSPLSPSPEGTQFTSGT